MASLRFVVLAAALLVGTCAVYGRNTRGLGKDDVIENSPWLVQIHYASGNVCGGTIMDATHILSAAHCFTAEEVADPKSTGVQIRAGATYKMNFGQLVDVSKIDMHPDAEFGKTMTHDLAVLTLAEPLEFNDSVQPIEFAKQQVEPSDIVNGGGWGVVEDGLVFKPVLQTFTLEMKPNEDCRRDVALTNNLYGMKLAVMCFRAKTGVPCSGDSGSGLWIPARDGQRAQLIGVAQGSSGCKLHSQSVYVNVLSDINRDFLSQFFDMSGVPITVTPPGEETPEDKMKRLIKEGKMPAYMARMFQ